MKRERKTLERNSAYVEVRTLRLLDRNSPTTLGADWSARWIDAPAPRGLRVMTRALRITSMTSRQKSDRNGRGNSACPPNGDLDWGDARVIPWDVHVGSFLSLSD